MAGVDSPQGPPEAVSDWIARAARWIEGAPWDLHLIYLPHLDYNLQRLGPDDPQILADLTLVDDLVVDLIEDLEAKGVSSLILSEYGIPLQSDMPYILIRFFRQQGWLTIKEELGKELIDFGATRSFAVCDHQVAHICLKDPSKRSTIRPMLETMEGIAMIWEEPERKPMAWIAAAPAILWSLPGIGHGLPTIIGKRTHEHLTLRVASIFIANPVTIY